jgi:hypothetical protein
MRSYIRLFTKLLNATEDVSVDREIYAFGDGIRRESYIEELGRKKPKLSPSSWRLLTTGLMVKTTYGSHAHATMMKKMIRST